MEALSAALDFVATAGLQLADWLGLPLPEPEQVQAACELDTASWVVYQDLTLPYTDHGSAVYAANGCAAKSAP
jgi:hypothetical protein